MTVEVTESGVEAPFDPSKMLSFQCLEYWARVAPDRKALIYTDENWKVRKGTLNRTVDPSQWKELTYKEFYDIVLHFRAALHQAGVPKEYKEGGYRVVIMLLPKTKIQLMAMILALQAAGCVTMFATPKAMGGLRPWIRALMNLEPDAILCTRMVRQIFRSIAATVATPGREFPLRWLNGALLEKSLTVKPPQEYLDLPTKNIPLDSVVVLMFSGGTTGFPTPIEVTHRMQCFQAANYAQKLYRETFGEDPRWLSAHIFANFVMLDLMLGGTAVLQPMGTSTPDETVCTVSLRNIMQHFSAQVSSAPPALWSRLARDCDKGALDCLKLGFVGGAETSAKFCRDVSELLTASGDSSTDSEFVRVYGTTQVLPVAEALAKDVIEDEEKLKVCASGCGVLLGTGAKGLDFSIDSMSWGSKGGLTELDLPDGRGTVQLGELCVRGKPLSPSLESVEVSKGPNEPPTRLFRTGDVCYIDSDKIHFLGRIAQSVDCGKMNIVPPVGVEMLCLENEIADRCAFVQAARNGKHIPVVVVQFDKKEMDMDAVVKILAVTLHSSVWGGLLNANLHMATYPRLWPVDERHSSKCNRLLLGRWASRLPEAKLLKVQ